METLEGKVVVVTGGASGIGLAIARAVAGQGAIPVVADIEVGALDEALAPCPTSTLAVATDVSDLASVEALRDAVLDRHGRVDVICNNAGVSTFNLIADQTIDDWRWVLDVNLWGVIHGVSTFLPVMTRQGTPGHVVNVSSVAGLMSGIPFIGPYAVSKVGVVSLSETLRQELGSPVCPSACRSCAPARPTPTSWSRTATGRPPSHRRPAPRPAKPCASASRTPSPLPPGSSRQSSPTTSSTPCSTTGSG